MATRDLISAGSAPPTRPDVGGPSRNPSVLRHFPSLVLSAHVLSFARTSYTLLFHHGPARTQTREATKSRRSVTIRRPARCRSLQSPSNLRNRQANPSTRRRWLRWEDGQGDKLRRTGPCRSNSPQRETA